MRAVLDGTNGRTLTVGPIVRRSTDGHEPLSFHVTLTTELAHASATVLEYGASGPTAFFQDLAQSWRGWDGRKTYASLEHQLTLECRHDGHGLVLCEVTVGSVVPPAWRLSAEVTFGGGAHLDRLARELGAAFETRPERLGGTPPGRADAR